jgi:hypothetical protein
MNRNLVTFIVLVSAFFLWSGVTFGQTEGWENRLVSRHAVATLNLNVNRLSKTFEGSESFARTKEMMLKWKKLDLDQIDHFQSIICRDPELGVGADDTAHHQVTFLESQTWDAATVGNFSGYKLTDSEIGKWKAFIGSPKNEGSWGAIPIDDRPLVFGVTRMLNSIVESQSIEISAAHKLETLRKQDVDFCITFSGGKPIAEVFASAWNTNQFSSTFELLDNGLIYFDGQSDEAFVGELNATSEKAAIQLEAELGKLTKLGHGFIAFLKKPMEERLKSLEELQGDSIEKIQAELEFTLDLLERATKTLDQLEISRNGARIKVISREKDNLKMLIEVLLKGL